MPPACSYAQNNKDKNSLIQESLRNYWHCKIIGCEKGLPFFNFIPYDRRYYNDSSKNELLILLEREITDKELVEFAKLSVRKYINSEVNSLKKSNENLQLSTKQRKLVQKRLDSLETILKSDSDTFPLYEKAVKKRKTEISRFKIDDTIILLSGLLDDKLFVPVLKRKLNDSIHFNSFAIKLALARLMEQPFHSEMVKYLNVDTELINRMKNDHLELSDYFSSISSDLIYISSQQSLMELSKFLPVELKVADKRVLLMDDSGYSPVSRQAFEAIVNKIENKELREYVIKNSNELNVPLTRQNVRQETSIEKKHIIFLQNWMKRNFGSYQINRNN